MNPLDFLNNIKNGLTEYFSPKVSTPVPIDQYRGNNAQPALPQAQQQQMLPGENEWVGMMVGKNQGQDPNALHALYKKAVTSPGGSYYQKPQLVQGQQMQQQVQQAPQAAPSAPQPMPTDIPHMTRQNPQALESSVEKLYQSRTPGNQSMKDYYPIAPYLNQIVQRGESIRPGLGVLAALQAFYESTGGRGGGNFWGVLPGGEGNAANGNKIAAMDTNKQMDYLFGPNVLGGGGNPNMNVAGSGDTSPLNVSRIRQLYQSYNPEGSYLPNLLSDYTQVMGGR